MSLTSASGVNIIGAGLAGSLLAILLARRGFRVSVYERRPDPRTSAADSGRSINLALAARGIRGLRLAGVLNRVMPLAIPMRGRMVHEHDGRAELQPYGVRPEEVIYSVDRGTLNRTLVKAAAAYPTVEFRFQQLCLGLKDHAVRQYGLLARTVLERWGIRATGDFGKIVFAMIDAGLMKKTDDDSLEDFCGVYDFDEAFATPATAGV